MIDSQFGWMPAKLSNPIPGLLLKKGRMTASQWVMPAGMKSTPPPGTDCCSIFSTSSRVVCLVTSYSPGFQFSYKGRIPRSGDDAAVLEAELNQVSHVLVVDAQGRGRRRSYACDGCTS